MQILLLGCNRQYLNAHTELFTTLLGVLGDLTCYGPGFVEGSILKKGIQAFVETREPFDLIVTDSFVLDWPRLVQLKHPFDFSYINFSPVLYRQFVEDAEDFFSKSNVLKLFLLNLDSYSVSPELIERIDQSQAYIVGVGHQFLCSLKEVVVGLDTWGANANDNFYNFSVSHSERFISLPFFVAETEISYADLSGRPFSLQIPGAGYSERRAMRLALGLDNAASDFTKRLKEYYLAKRAKPWTRKDILLTRFNFMSQIEDTKMCYVTGSSLRCLVRKYFEVPAKGSVLACASANGLQEVGFRPGENCLLIEDAGELQKYLSADGAVWHDLQEVADRGRDLILEQHTLGRRVDQLRMALTAILAGTFNGSYWKNGEFHIVSKVAMPEHVF